MIELEIQAVMATALNWICFTWVWKSCCIKGGYPQNLGCLHLDENYVNESDFCLI